MKTSLSLVSILIGLGLTGVQAELPYNMPDEYRRDAIPPMVSPEHSKWDYPHHHPTGTAVHLPGHHEPHPTGYHHHHNPTGYPHYPYYPHHQASRDNLLSTFMTVAGTGGHARPTGHPGPYRPHPPHLPHPCNTDSDCRFLACTTVMPNTGPKCAQGRERKFCTCEEQVAV
ncbi:hypothetical protein AAE478_010144 [Parahypoxylon ruwenzoriense]